MAWGLSFHVCEMEGNPPSPSFIGMGKGTMCWKWHIVVVIIVKHGNDGGKITSVYSYFLFIQQH
jgi:hypothetical protein